MARLVLKLFDCIRLDEEAFTKLPVFQANDPKTYGQWPAFRESYKAFFERPDTLYQYCIPVLPSFWANELLNLDSRWVVRPLFRANAPAVINDLVTMAVKATGVRYSGVNFYNYFVVQGDESALNELLGKWKAFQPPTDDPFDPVTYPVEVCYMKGEGTTFATNSQPYRGNVPRLSDAARFTPFSAGEGNQGTRFLPLKQVAGRAVAAFSQRFWADLNLASLPVPVMSATGDVTNPVTIVDIEYGWDLSSPELTRLLPGLVYGINSSVGAAHGRNVLELLIARHDGPRNPDPVKGIAPTARVELCSAYGSTVADSVQHETDDALLHAIWRKRSSPGTILLLEIQLRIAPSYDPGASRVLGWANYPVETEQAIFDLISLATRTLQLLVVEAAGNRTLANNPGINLDNYTPRPFSDSDRRLIDVTGSFSTVTKAETDVWTFYTRECPHRNRRLQYDAEADSGAVMVGAAFRQASGQWVVYSNYGSRIDVYAPGGGVAVSSGLFTDTSAASALIAGSVARLQQIRRAASPTRPDWTGAGLRDEFRRTLIPPPPRLVQMPDMAAIASL